jgi:hypothetical protein
MPLHAHAALVSDGRTFNVDLVHRPRVTQKLIKEHTHHTKRRDDKRIQVMDELKIEIKPALTRVKLGESTREWRVARYRDGDVTLTYELVRGEIHNRLRKGRLIEIEVRNGGLL